VENRFSPNRPLIAAALFTGLAGGMYAYGYRGRYKADATSMDFGMAVRFLILMAAGSFVLFYLLRILGVEIGWMGGRETQKKKPKGP
jgi:hypothetical protein